jgi:RNA 2',3'-cyclic 3'-phosphodiesterase
MRLFLAINLPEEFKEEILHRCQSIQKRCFKNEQHHLLKWAGKEQLHITQYFLGEIDKELLPTITKALTKTIQSYSTFTLSTEELCWMPVNSPVPKMLWLKFQLHETFTQLSHSLFQSLSAILPVAEKPHDLVIPHVTLIRLKKVKPYSLKLNQPKTHSINVKKIELWQSFLDSKGAKYQPLEAFYLNK